MTKKKNVYLFQPASPNDIDGALSYWLPYSVGCLWSYAQQNPTITENFNLADLIFKKVPIEILLDTISEPAVAAFSCYVWNYEYNKRAAAAIKEKWPECVIVFGGPQVTKRPYENSFFKRHPYVNTVINGEGEGAFLNVLLLVQNNKTVPKLSKFARMDNLEYPSPYTSGVFDKIIRDNPDYTWQITIETNRGCPYSCTFCDWGSLTYAKVLKFSEQRVLDDIRWAGNNKVDYMFIADANFGLFYSRDKKFAQAINQCQVTTGRPKTVIAQWAKNAKHQVLDIAKIFFNGSANRGFTVSVQSMNDQTLDAIKRKNMDVSDLKEMMVACEKEGIPAYTEVILGLPYETYDTWKQNINILLEAGQHQSFDVWLCQLLENSELNTIEQRELHGIQSITVPKWITGTIVDDTDIQEMEVLVSGTKYMPFDDLIKSYMFSYVVMTFHYIGWTQVISRFLKKYKNIDYVELYSYIEQKIVSGNSILTTEYNKIKDFITKFLSGSGHDNPLIFAGQSVLWTSIGPFLENRDAVITEVFNMLSNDYCDLDPVLFEELKSLQSNYMYDFSQQDSMIESYSHDIYNYVFNDSELLDAPVTLEFSTPFKFTSRQTLSEKAYYRRRMRVAQRRIKILPNLDNN